MPCFKKGWPQNHDGLRPTFFLIAVNVWLNRLSPAYRAENILTALFLQAIIFLFAPEIYGDELQLSTKLLNR